jgi:hypothetical protein
MKPLQCQSQRGAGLIVVVLILVVVSMVIAAFVSLINSESFTAMNQSAGLEAFGISEGGIEYGKRYLRPYATWYSFATDPITPAAGLFLGSGSFTTIVNFPATALSKTVGAAVTQTKICVRTKDRFPTTFNFYALVENEYMQCTANNGAACYTCSRGVLLSSPAPHFQDTPFYPVVQLSAGGITATDTTIPFSGSPSKFLNRGTILIDDPVNGDEEINYGAIQTTPSLAFINCIRGVDGYPAAVHTGGQSIVPIQTKDGVNPTQQAFLQSTGVRATILGSSAQRVLTDVINQ